MRNGLDRIDLKLLCALQDEARISNLELSRLVSMSASACLARVQRLRELGYIQAEVTVLAAAKLGPVLHASLEVYLDAHTLQDHKRFQQMVRRIPEVTFAVKTSGRYDYLLAVTVCDMKHLSRLSDDLLDSGLGITRLVTIPVLDVVKPFAGFPVRKLAGRSARERLAAE